MNGDAYTVQHSDRPHNELREAKEWLNHMRAATTADQTFKSWMEFLVCLQRVYNQTKSHFKKSPKWVNWVDPYWKKITSDPLLLYLNAARNAREHSGDDLLRYGHNPDQFGKNRKRVLDLHWNEDGSLSQSKTRLGWMQVLPSQALLVEIKDEQNPKNVKVFPVPRMHLGKPIDPHDIIQVAQMGIDFYDDFLNKAEAFFVEGDRANG